MTLKEHIEYNIQYYTRNLQKCVELSEASRFMEVDEEVGTMNEWAKQITLKARDQEHAGRLIKKITNKVGTVKKGFDEHNGQLYCEAEHDGVKIRIEYGPSDSCHIERVEEEVAIPARTEKRVKYVKSGECDPIYNAEALAQKFESALEETNGKTNHSS